MSQLDLNLLYVLIALEEQRSVSRAAAKLDRSQPAVSAALAKLRAFFDDALFLRVGNTMQPTPLAAAVTKSARPLLDRIGSEIVAPRTFEPMACDRPVKIALSDVGEVVFLPGILKKMRELMPKAAMCSVSLRRSAPATGMPDCFSAWIKASKVLPRRRTSTRISP